MKYGVAKILILFTLFIRMPCAAQHVHIRGKSLAIRDVFEKIRRQTGYDVLFSPDVLNDAPAVDLDFRNSEVRQVLTACLAGLQLGYRIEGKAILVYRKVGLDDCLYLPLQGQVQSATGEPLAGASISVDGVLQQHTLAGGSFQIPVKARRTTVTISLPDYVPRTVGLYNTGFQLITLQPAASLLDQVIIQAYGQTTPRYLTSSVARVKGDLLAAQPGGNVLQALEGRVTGMTIRQYSGVPGSAFETLVRGRHSISQGTEPLVVVDGVPIADNDGLLSTIGAGSAQGVMGASVLNGIPPSAIASIEVLRDAAATAIYGSRGANGVLLVTLKTGEASEKLRWSAELSSGPDAAVRTGRLLNIRQYLAMRREAILNDGLTVDAATLPEGFFWDSTRNTDYKKFVEGSPAWRQHIRIDCTGGDTNTVFLLSGNDQREAAVFPGPTGDDRISLYGHLHRQSVNRRLRLDLSTLYSWENNRLPIQDYTPFAWLAPNAPPFSDAAGQPVWKSNGLSFANIPALESNHYQSSVRNQLNHLQLSYTLLPGLSLRASLGYSAVLSNEYTQQLIAGQDPATNPSGQTQQIVNTGESELVEGLAEYKKEGRQGKLEALLGSTWQEQRAVYSSINASGYPSDLLLETGGGSPTISTTGSSVVYRYEAVFGRLNYIFRNRYIATFSGRRDGSSRFGPGEQFGNFWGIGTAWIFNEEPFLRKERWLSFGKLRLSAGTTGNDLIGDNSYSAVYSPTTSARGYQTRQGGYPVSSPNPDLHWEVNYSSELALDLGFFHNNLLVSMAGYRDWTGNQLIYNALPAQSGLPGQLSNLPVNIVNEGLEFSVRGQIFSTPQCGLTTTVLLTTPVNRLASFPTLGTSLYANSLVPGRSLTVVNGYQYEGVNPQSGLFQFRDVNHDGRLDSRDLVPGGNLDLKYYGSCTESLRYKNWQLDLFVEFRVQNGFNPYVTLYQLNPPGFAAPSMLGNGPAGWLDHWRRPGDHARLQQVTESYGSVAYQRMQEYIGSDAQSIDASFIRWKSLSLTYRLPASLMHRWGLREGRIYLRGQNLLTYTHFPVTDPETQDPTVLPPVRSLVAGMGVNF